MKISTIALLAAAGLSLAACGRRDEAEATPDANLTNITLPEDAPDDLTNQAPVTPSVENTVQATPAEPVTLAPEEQTQDDADATGMTARISRDEEGNSTGQPVK